MKKLHFTYNMLIEYSIEVSKCNFTIKCIPKNSLRQKIENLKIDLYPKTSYQVGTDGFQNHKIYGINHEQHTIFQFQLEGDAVTGLSSYEELEDTDISAVFKYPHGLNIAGASIQEFYKSMKNINESTYERAIRMMHALYHKFEYRTGTTNVETTAEEAFCQGYGVCQDYAHIMISLLHLSNIAARYVTGFIIGEGESHAWVEYLDDGKWYGIDPTNDKCVNDEYIKIGHGRDAKDCLINRGIVYGGGMHTQNVQVNVREI